MTDKYHSWMNDFNLSDDARFMAGITTGVAALTQIFSIEYAYNPRQLVFQRDKVKLYHYRPRKKRPHQIPLLVVFATVNRPEILDLFPEKSFIGGLLQNGMDVYLLDWGYPDINDFAISIDDYVTEYLKSCVDFICETTEAPQINLLGICQGGVITLSYTSLYDNIKNLVLISTPIDFQTKENVISHMFNKLDVDGLISISKNLSGLWLTNFFISLRPFELVGKKYLRFIDNVEDEAFVQRFLRVEKWLYDAPDQTGASFAQLVTQLYQQNQLLHGKFKINGQGINLANIKIPVLNVMASEDEIVPMSASKCLKQMIGSEDYHEEIFKSGHIGIYVSEKVGEAMPRQIASWLKMR